MHSTVSDGTDTPEEILGKVTAQGIELFSVTDHDAIEGAVIIKNMPHTPAFIPGIEFSCKDKHGKYHVLGYGYDENAPQINKVVKKAHEIRIRKVMDRIAFLKEAFGFTFEQQDIDSIFENHNPGKPHISKMMIKYGYASSIKDAMDNYLNKKKFGEDCISPEEAINAINESSGIPVLAHPCYGDGSQLILGEEMDKRMKRLVSYGLKGTECYYSGFTSKLIEQMLGYAEKYDLLVTAGSDYHGTNKLVRLGDTNLPDASKADRRLLEFVERFI